eukprot:g29582.t1
MLSDPDRLSGPALEVQTCLQVTLPTDVVKVRLQVQSTGRYRGFADCLQQTARNEGVHALWKGLTPALVRQVCYTSMSLVIYEPIRGFYGELLGGKDKGPSYFQRLCAGGTAGALAISVFNPAEVVKTQVQTHVGANITMREVAASGIAGFSSACVSTPADVVKTRLMNAAGEDVKQYRGMLHGFSQILMQEGVTALYKGFLPICIRLSRLRRNEATMWELKSGYYGAYQYGHFPRGRRAHVVQVGLGDNRTFLHDMVAVRRQEYHTGVGWLLNACSEGDICGVAVEPVWEHFEAAHELAKENRLRNVALVQAALGEYSGRTAIYRVQEPEKSQLDWLDEDDREDCNQ